MTGQCLIAFVYAQQCPAVGIKMLPGNYLFSIEQHFFVPNLKQCDQMYTQHIIKPIVCILETLALLWCSYMVN